MEVIQENVWFISICWARPCPSCRGRRNKYVPEEGRWTRHKFKCPEITDVMGMIMQIYGGDKAAVHSVRRKAEGSDIWTGPWKMRALQAEDKVWAQAKKHEMTGSPDSPGWLQGRSTQLSGHLGPREAVLALHGEKPGRARGSAALPWVGGALEAELADVGKEQLRKTTGGEGR